MTYNAATYRFRDIRSQMAKKSVYMRPKMVHSKPFLHPTFGTPPPKKLSSQMRISYVSDAALPSRKILRRSVAPLPRCLSLDKKETNSRFNILQCAILAYGGWWVSKSLRRDKQKHRHWDKKMIDRQPYFPDKGRSLFSTFALHQRIVTRPPSQVDNTDSWTLFITLDRVTEISSSSASSSSSSTWP